MKKEVHDTAFMIAYYRAMHEALSKDPYAKLWPKGDLKNWADDFAEKVSEHDELLHCMRNRYFHDVLKDFTKENEDTLFINLGAGFSMYPYILPKTVSTIEIELPQIVTFKKDAINSFISKGKLPNRNVVHMSGDITDENHHGDIVSFIKAYKKPKTIILIEGVFFFLNKKQIESVLRLCERIQKKDDLLLCVSFDKGVNNTEVFSNLKLYFTDVLDSHENPFTSLPHNFYKTIDGYSLEKRSSSLELGQKLDCFPDDFDEELVLNEYFYTLKKS